MSKGWTVWIVAGIHHLSIPLPLLYNSAGCGPSTAVHIYSWGLMGAGSHGTWSLVWLARHSRLLWAVFLATSGEQSPGQDDVSLVGEILFTLVKEFGEFHRSLRMQDLIHRATNSSRPHIPALLTVSLTLGWPHSWSCEGPLKRKFLLPALLLSSVFWSQGQAGRKKLGLLRYIICPEVRHCCLSS